MWRWARRHARPLSAEQISLARASGRVLADGVTAPRSLPPFHRSAMDGYLVNPGAADKPLKVVGTLLPGQAPPPPPAPGEALRILTGAAVPDTALAVVPQEQTQMDAGGLHLECTPTPGQYIELRGSDVAMDAVLFYRGRRLRPQDCALLVRLGAQRVAVVRRPRVRLLATGDELLPPGQPTREAQLPETNVWMLANLVARDGGEVVEERWLPDDPRVIAGTLAAPGADLVVVSGGSGPGDRDYPPRLLARDGELAFHGLALQPAASTGLGRLGETLVCLLPGNPVSCLCAYELLVGRLVRWLGGLPGGLPHRRRRLPLARDLDSRSGVLAYWRVTLRQGAVVPLTAGAASRYSSITAADGFVLVPPGRHRLVKGEPVQVYLYD